MGLPKDLNERNDWFVALWKAAKEPLRLLVLSILPILITRLSQLDYQWAVVGTLLLRLADKFLHEVGKATDNETLTLGLTRF